MWWPCVKVAAPVDTSLLVAAVASLSLSMSLVVVVAVSEHWKPTVRVWWA